MTVSSYPKRAGLMRRFTPVALAAVLSITATACQTTLPSETTGSFAMASPPPTTPAPLAENASGQVVFVDAGTQPTGTYTFYFYNPPSGPNLGGPSTAVISYTKATCP